MAAQDGFANGMQMGLGMFNAMQNASYQQQLMANAEENQQMRRQQIAIDAQSKAAAQFQQRFSRNEFIINNASKMGTDMVLDAYNEMNSMMGGTKRINPIDIETFKTDSTSYLNAVKSAPDDESANKLINEYRAKAATHPILNEIGNFQVKLMEDAKSRRQLVKDLEVLGIGNSQWREKYVGDGDPNVIREMVKNNDMRGMMQYQFAQDVMLRHESGGNVSPSELSTAIAFLHTKGGGELKKDGKSIFEPANRAQFHQETINSLKEAQNTFDPLLGATRLIKPEDAKALNDAANVTRTLASTYDPERGVYGALGLGAVKHENDAVTQTSQILQKYPQIQQTLQQVGPQAVQMAGSLRRQLEQLERDKKAATAAVTMPNRTEHLERLDQQIKVKREQLMPWETVEAAFNTPESPNAMKALLTLDKRMNKALAFNETRRVENLTESEKNAKRQTDLQYKEYHVEKVGPAQVENALFQWSAQNPGATEDQLRGKAAEFGQVYKKQFGVMPDMNKVVDSFITKKTQQTILTGEERKVVSEAEANVAAADTLIRDFKPEYFGSVDNALNALKAKMPEGSPQFMQLSADVQEYRQRVELFRTQYRKRIFGSSLTEGEKESAMNSMINLDMGDKQARATLQEMRKWELKAIESTKRNAQKSEQVKQGTDPYAQTQGEKSIEDFKAFYQKNKGRFANPDDAAAVYFGGAQ